MTSFQTENVRNGVRFRKKPRPHTDIVQKHKIGRLQVIIGTTHLDLVIDNRLWVVNAEMVTVQCPGRWSLVYHQSKYMVKTLPLCRDT